MTVSRRLRFEVLRRDGYACRYCGSKAPEVELTVDHVVPVALGGSDEPSNLVAACRDCNAGKSSVPADSRLVADVEQDALRWARAMSLAAEKQAKSRLELEVQYEAFVAHWPDDTDPTCFGAPSTWRESVERFLSSGLSQEELAECVGVALRSPARNGNVWRYFCGVAWRRLNERQGIAREAIQSGEVD